MRKFGRTAASKHAGRGSEAGQGFNVRLVEVVDMGQRCQDGVARSACRERLLEARQRLAEYKASF